MGRVAGPEVELLTIAVDPDYRRQGLAHDLMRDFEQMAKENGARDAFLEVAENNIAAIGLYQRRGFTQTGLRKDYYASLKGPRISAIVMNKPL
ncbi:MAG: GNAT family N-acetyltransferase [Proteobacteria bacterium]|nr:GNAT family N-acetyltransferase [Pseudomonadota bacterium]